MKTHVYKEMKDFFELNAAQIDEKYAKNVLFEISRIIPIIEDKTKVFIKLETSFKENYYISRFVGEEKKILKKKDEVYHFINGLLGYLEVNLYNLILQNPIGHMIALYQILDYNLQMTPLILKILKKEVNEEEIEDKHIRNLANSLNTFKQLVEENQFKKTLRYVEKIIATDKQAFQKTMNYILSYDLKWSKINIQNSLDIECLIELSRDIYHTLSIRQQIFSDIEHNYLIIEKGNIFTKADDPILNEAPDNIYDLMSSSFESNFKFGDEVNNIMKEFIGIDNKSIENVVSKFLNGEINLPGLVFVNDEGLITFLKNLLLISDSNANKLKKELTLYKTDMSIVPKNLSLKEGRLLRKSILEVEEGVYIFSEFIFIFSLLGLAADIREGNIINKDFEKKLFKYFHLEHLEFENNIMKLLEENTSYLSLNKGVVETYFKEFRLPGEIDILIVIEGVLFVIECKAFSMKFNISSILSEVKKVKSISFTKSIQQKLKSKVDSIIENKSTVEEVLKCKINKVEGVIVTKNPSFAYQAKTGFFEVIHSSQILDYINERI